MLKKQYIAYKRVIDMDMTTAHDDCIARARSAMKNAENAGDFEREKIFHSEAMVWAILALAEAIHGKTDLRVVLDGDIKTAIGGSISVYSHI